MKILSVIGALVLAFWLTSLHQRHAQQQYDQTGTVVRRLHGEPVPAQDGCGDALGFKGCDPADGHGSLPERWQLTVEYPGGRVVSPEVTREQYGSCPEGADYPQCAGGRP